MLADLLLTAVVDTSSSRLYYIAALYDVRKYLKQCFTLSVCPLSSEVSVSSIVLYYNTSIEFKMTNNVTVEPAPRRRKVFYR